MNKITAIALSLGLVSSLAWAEEESPLKDDTAKLNYSVGYQIGKDFKTQEMDLNTDLILQGVKDALEGKETLISHDEMRNVMSRLGQKIAAEKRAKREAMLAQVKQQSIDFLVENGKKPGIVTTASGLQYQILKEGKGETHPKLTDTVMVNYSGKLIDGTAFDSSTSRGDGRPATFRVDQVIPGWTEALQLMKRDAHWLLFIPSQLAYGEQGAGAKIPPNSTLVFDVELVSFHE